MALRPSKSGHAPDYFLLALVALLTIFGLVMLTSASSDIGKSRFNDSYYYIKHQLVSGVLVGAIGFFLASRINYQFYKKISFPLLLVSLVLLSLVFTGFGVTSHNASRWVRIGPLSFQPAEILKLTYIIYLAAWLSNPKTNRHATFYEGFLPFLIVSGSVALLLLLQPATSVVVILMASGLVIYFMSNAHMRYIFAVFILGAGALAAIVYFTPYRWQRISGYLHGGSDIQGANYQRTQAIIAIGSGGVWGSGYGQSTAKVNYLPGAVDDSIFAVISQELGFVGAGSLVAVFALLIFRLYWLAWQMRDRFGALLLIGFGTIIALQSFINIAAISGLTPLTGVPLPFISYGGTALAVFLTMSGISLNISKYV